MGLELGINLVKEVFTNTTFSGSYLIVQMFIILASLALLSREPRHWRTLALPVMIGWHTIGFFISYVFIVLGTILFVVETMSTEVLSGAIGAVGNAVGWAKRQTDGTERALRGSKVLRNWQMDKTIEQLNAEEERRSKIGKADLNNMKYVQNKYKQGIEKDIQKAKEDYRKELISKRELKRNLKLAEMQRNSSERAEEQMISGELNKGNEHLMNKISFKVAQRGLNPTYQRAEGEGYKFKRKMKVRKGKVYVTQEMINNKSEE